MVDRGGRGAAARRETEKSIVDSLVDSPFIYRRGTYYKIGVRGLVYRLSDREWVRSEAVTARDIKMMNGLDFPVNAGYDEGVV